MGVLNKVTTVFAIKDVNLDINKCKQMEISMGNSEEDAINQCTEENLFSSDTVPYKFLYEQGIITGEVIDVNYPIKENDVSKKVDTIGVGLNAFESKNIASVSFPNSIEMIRNSAFYGNQLSGDLDLSHLTKLTYVSGFNDNQITSIKLPSSVETIGKSAFYGNSISGELDLSNTKISGVRYWAFSDNQITSVKLPNSVKTIENLAFDKDSVSNPNLITIINLSGNIFDWSSVTGSGTSGQSFASGTITHFNGDITVTAE